MNDRQINTPLSPRVDLEIALLEKVIDRIVAPGMTCCEIGAYSGAFTKRVLRVGCTCTAIEPYPLAYNLLKKKYGHKCKVVSALVADAARGYRIKTRRKSPLLESALFTFHPTQGIQKSLPLLMTSCFPERRSPVS